MNENHTFVPIPPPDADALISLQHRQPLHFTSRVAPWTVFGPNIKIVSDIPSVSGSNPGRKRALTEQAIEQLGSFDLSLWTDGNVLSNGHGGSACISHSPTPVANPYKRQRLTYALPVCIMAPAGRLCNPADAELGALQTALQYILDHRQELTNKRIFIGTDCQSILRAMEKGPHRPFSYLGVDPSPLWESIYWILDFCQELVLH